MLAAGGAWFFLSGDQDSAARRGCTDGLLSVAAVGDIMMGSDVVPPERASGETRELLRSSNLALGSLAMTLLEQPDLADARGPHGGVKHARLLQRWGFSVLVRANARANDFAGAGLAQTSKLLQHNKLVSAGAGADLGAARAPGWVNTPCGRVAVIGVSTALSDQDLSPALPTRNGIAGRPGINPLHYTKRTLVDAETYAKLREANAKMGGPAPEANGTLHAFGMTLEPGERNASITTVDAEDQSNVLEAIREARKTAALVIVSIHSYEAGDQAGEPAPLVEDFARAAVEAGAGLVVGHGTLTPRVVEFHGDGLIAYGLGDFIADSRIGAELSGATTDAPSPSAEEPVPQGAILSATFRDGHVVTARLDALTLAAAQDLPQGFPRLGDAAKVFSPIASGSAVRGAMFKLQKSSAEIVAATGDPAK